MHVLYAVYDLDKSLRFGHHAMTRYEQRLGEEPSLDDMLKSMMSRLNAVDVLNTQVGAPRVGCVVCLRYLCYHSLVAFYLRCTHNSYEVAFVGRCTYES